MVLRASSLIVVAILALGKPALAEPTTPPTKPAAAAPAVLATAMIAKQYKQSIAALEAPLRPRVQAAARTLLERLTAPLPPKANKRDVLAIARQVVADGGYLGLATRQPANIDTVVLLVLLEASQVNEQDLARVRSERASIAAIKACKRNAKCLGQLGPIAPMTAADFDRLRSLCQTKGEMADKLGTNDVLLLQQATDKKRQLETMISNLMKAGYDIGQAAVGALKAS